MICELVGKKFIWKYGLWFNLHNGALNAKCGLQLLIVDVAFIMPSRQPHIVCCIVKEPMIVVELFFTLVRFLAKVAFNNFIVLSRMRCSLKDGISW